MQYYALIYHVVDDYITRRSQYRDEHLQLANDAHARGELVLGGAFADPPDKALLVWYVADKSVIEDFVSKDPYVKNGIVTKWEIRSWTVVIGQDIFKD
jgi:uncharacterized protein YciI